jgi:hypothetical protein
MIFAVCRNKAGGIGEITGVVAKKTTLGHLAILYLVSVYGAL